MQPKKESKNTAEKPAFLKKTGFFTNCGETVYDRQAIQKIKACFSAFAKARMGKQAHVVAND